MQPVQFKRILKEKNKMPDDYLEKLKEYRNYLKTCYRTTEIFSKEESLAGSIGPDVQMGAYEDAIKKLEDFFPELKESKGEK